MSTFRNRHGCSAGVHNNTLQVIIRRRRLSIINNKLSQSIACVIITRLKNLRSDHVNNRFIKAGNSNIVLNT